MKTEALQGLIEIAYENSIRKAAQNLDIPQQTLNKNMTSLENELGIQIFERDNHGVKLTDAGTEVYQFAKWCLQEYSDMHTELKIQDDVQACIEANDKITIGCVNTAIQNIMSRAVAELYRQQNKLELNVIQDTSLQIIDKVMKNQYQLGIVLQYQGEQVNYPLFDDSVLFYPVYRSKPYTWVSKKSSLSLDKYFKEEDAAQYSIIRLKENDEDMTNYIFQRNEIGKLEIIACENIYYATHMLAMNLGVVLDMKTNQRLNLEKFLSDIAIALPIKFQESYSMVTGILVKKEAMEKEPINKVVHFLLQQTSTK